MLNTHKTLMQIKKEDICNGNIPTVKLLIICYSSHRVLELYNILITLT